MFPAEYEATARDVRTFALVQVALTAFFLVLLFFALGGIDATVPPWWVITLLLGAVVAAGVLSERVWLTAPALDPADDPDQLQERAVAIFAAQTIRKLAICEAAVIFSIVVTFLGPYGAWPMVIGGLPGLALLAWEITPTLRTTSLTEAALDADGAESGLVESFKTW